MGAATILLLLSQGVERRVFVFLVAAIISALLVAMGLVGRRK
jgi:hypothetical protein